MSGKIKIFHVVRPAAGGIRNHLLDLVRRSHGDRFQHLAACPPGDLADSLAGMGIETFPVPLGGEISPGKDLSVIRTLVAICKRIGPEVLHAHGVKAGLAGGVAAVLAGVPAVVITLHSSIFHHRRPRWKENIIALSERALAGLADRIITVSGALGREIAARVKIDPAKIEIIYNGIMPEEFSREPDRNYLQKTVGIPGDKKIVGTVARLAPQKGVADFIRAAAMMAGEPEEAAFLVVGDGPLREDLERLAASLGLAGRVFFAGERRDMPKILPCLDVFVLASVTEGLPLAVLEALAARRPVVSTRVGGIPEVITDGVEGILVEPGDIPAMVSAVKSLLADRERSRIMGEAGRELVERKFTVEKMVRSTERVYLDLAGGGPSR